MATQSVRINKKIIARIRKQVKPSKQPISAFIDLVLDWKLTQLEQGQEGLAGPLRPISPVTPKK